ncbi:bifunctional folylpolyglutamate synthase/dihydrofolate synthase [Salmonirosea aquatica]|uniref:Dihydrofolate synthase/folylpolyglutamate synthase n=1 Tax=Salmonirosea aquatica TaxID=2654236 RepID=A0A7C9FZX5_9BACT|nr:bifunctional folylpolyglutamate synthase/dihydrofolate synthase [Cytophagaceae bacterium SJW1-29]
MTYEEAIAYLYSRLPVFQNHGARAYKPGLSTTRAFCERLGNPQNTYKTIHVGGTNGKGSTSHMLASVLQHAGYRVGLYTSPHLKSFTERIRVNGQPVREDFVSEFVTVHSDYIASIEPSFFEVTVAMAFAYFSSENVEVAVIEVGMGGRLDSTNIITPELALITNISFDHTQYLGDTLPKIAFEKAGIIKPTIPIVLSERMPPEVLDVFEERAAELDARLVVAAERITISSHSFQTGKLNIAVKYSHKKKLYRYQLDLLGEYQLNNVKGVLSALEILNDTGFVIHPSAIKSGLASVRTTTGLKGRWQQIQSEPLVLCDTAHNKAGLELTIGQFKQIEASKHRFVLGFVADKEIESILSLFSNEDTFYFCQPQNPRALPVENLVQAAQIAGFTGESLDNVNSALEKAIHDSNAADAIYVGGSTFVVADLNSL